MIWVLLGRRTGDNQQMLALAQASGLPFTPKPLKLQKAGKIPNILLGASRVRLTPEDRALLVPPWPDMVISSGRRTVPVARWIRAQADRRVRLVHIGRPWAPLGWFDLIITTPQYRLPDRANVVSDLMPLDAWRTSPPSAEEAAMLAHLPHPLVAVLVGGKSRPLWLDRRTATELARRAVALARDLTGSLLVVTGPRTPAAAMDVFADSLAAATGLPSLLHRWGARPNPYNAALALADRFVVTGDSASMIAAAAGTGRPVETFPLGVRPGLRARLSLATLALSRRSRPANLLFRLGIRSGLSAGPRDMPLYVESLREHGLLDGGPKAREVGEMELARAVARLRALAPEDKGQEPFT